MKTLARKLRLERLTMAAIQVADPFQSVSARNTWIFRGVKVAS